MAVVGDDPNITRCAGRLADGLADGGEPSFDAARARVDGEYAALLDAIRRSAERFAFDREGRPAAVAAVREALPAMERDLFDAVLDDHACELAAVEEALFQLARAFARARRE